MDFTHSIVLGLVEGVTEFLPISSTGHLILAGKLLGLPETEFLKTFEIAIQFGAILSVVVLYWKELWNWQTIKKLFTAFLPTAVIGLAFYKIIKTYLLWSEAVVLWALFIGGIALVAFEFWYKKHLNTPCPSDGREDQDPEDRSPSYKQALAIGFFQAIAIVPGVSRSAATILGGLWLGLKRTTIVEFSFLLAVPTMLAATALDLLKSYESFSADQFGVLGVGFAVSFIVALASIKFLLSYIRKYDFVPFGVYRIIVALVFWAAVL